MNELLNNHWPRIRYVAAIQALELIAIYLDLMPLLPLSLAAKKAWRAEGKLVSSKQVTYLRSDLTCGEQKGVTNIRRNILFT